MTLQEFMKRCEANSVEVYSHNAPIIDWFDDDPRYDCTVLAFGIIDDTTMWVDINEDEVKEIK